MGCGFGTATSYISLPSAVKFRPRYSHHGKVPVGLVEPVLTSSSTNIFLSALCDLSLMKLEVASIYSDKTRDKSVTNQILEIPFKVT
jgi:hypothetical protein